MVLWTFLKSFVSPLLVSRHAAGHAPTNRVATSGSRLVVPPEATATLPGPIGGETAEVGLMERVYAYYLDY